MELVSGKAYFILTHTMVTIEGAAKLFLYNMWKFHRLPEHIILDCRPQSIVLFTRELYQLLEIQLAFSTT